MKSSNTIEKLVRHPPDIFQTTSGHPLNTLLHLCLIRRSYTNYLGGAAAYLVVGNTLRLRPASYAELCKKKITLSLSDFVHILFY